MSKSIPLLTNNPPSVDTKVSAIVQKALQTIGGTNIVKIMKKNPYEKLVPLNIWFVHPKYEVTDILENNQHMRLRIFSGSCMTPLINNEKPELAHLKSFLGNLSLYQPFYPETFYGIWEFLRMEHLGGVSDTDSISTHNESQNFLHIGQEHSLGTMEAIIFYHEKYQHTYQYNKYDCVISGQEAHERIKNYYSFSLPAINYLGQAYKINFLENSSQMKKYNLISIDVCHRFDNIFKWMSEEKDLECSLFYLLLAIKHLNKNGAVLIRFNLVGSSAWAIIFDMMYSSFREHTVYRPSINNPFNSEVYLFLNKFEDKPLLVPLQNRFYQNLYLNKVYSKFFMNCRCIKENPIFKKYEIEKKKWCERLTNVLENFDIDEKRNDAVTNWHIANDLKQISDAKPEFDDNVFKGLLKTSAKQFTIKPVLPNALYELSYYKKLIKKRAELNYHKRVMDTKPSQIFTNYHQRNRQTYLLGWEHLTSKTDVYRNVKFRLKDQYRAEMATNAFIKIYEMLNILPKLFVSKQASIKTFHICEAPGAFIAAMNHFLSDRKSKWDWYAQTLKPVDEKTDLALEDHFGLIASYPDRWLFGKDGTGDITHSCVIRSYASDPKLKNIDFMTADAGLKCDPIDLNEQEAYLGKINMGQVVCILACLAIGKSAIFKTFLPMTEPLTLSLMYLLTHVFESVQLVKPATSHSYNSEIYIVLSGYKGIDEKQLELLYVLLDDPNITSKTLLFQLIDKTFFKSYKKTVGKLVNRQIASLSRNYYYYYHFNEVRQLEPIREQCTVRWFEDNQVIVLDDNKKLLKNQNNNNQNFSYE